MLSVVIITCNREKEVKKAIDSCIAHTQRLFQLVVVDNNSTDSTKSVVDSYNEMSSRLKVKYIKLEENTGVSFARNVGYRAADGEILFFIDDDAEVVSNGYSLDEVYDYMLMDKSIYASAGVSLDPRYGGQMKFVFERGTKDDLYPNVRSYIGFNHFIKKGFNERDYIYPDNLFYGSEELYVGLSVLKHGGKIKFFKNHIVQHNPSLNTRIDPREGHKNGHINTYVIKKYFVPKFFAPISYMLFLLRIFRFAKGNSKEIIECHKKVSERFNRDYRDTFSVKQMIDAAKKFGIKYLI